jgi:hypothetical protein
MTKELEKAYSNALATYNATRITLADATVAYDRERHAHRKSLYDLKESGQRKMTEEQIRSESVVACAKVYEDYTRALCAHDVAREHLEFIKEIIKDNN